MIASHQPSVFPDDVIVRVSSVDDGTMLDRFKADHERHDIENREAFCASVGVNYDDVVGQMIVYGDEMTYDITESVGSADTSKHTKGVIADALRTPQPGVGLMLPVADCVATVIYDAANKEVYMLHLGRHSTLSPLLRDTLAAVRESGVAANDIFVWMSPHAGKDSYVMRYFDQADEPDWSEFCYKKDDGFYLDLAGYNRQICIGADVPSQNIEVSAIDTVTDGDYFSHSGGDTDKRFAVVAMMRP